MKLLQYGPVSCRRAVLLTMVAWPILPALADVPDVLMADGGAAPPGYSWGGDLSDIEAYTDPAGTANSEALGAQAYGSDVVFADSPEARVVAEESAHAIQQASGRRGGGQNPEAEATAEAALRALLPGAALCRSPCGWEVLGLSVSDITAGIASLYGGPPVIGNLAWIGPYSASSQPRLLDSFSSWTERFQPEPDYSVRLNSGNGWHMLVSDQYVPGLVTTFDPRGLDQLPTPGAGIIGNLFTGTTAQDAVLLAVANGENLALLGSGTLNLAGLLPIHVYVQWDAGARDFDLHATGPLGAGRFHVYYSSPGSLTLAPNTFLHRDCICEGGSEVITLNDLNPGGVYRFSVFNFGNQDPTSTELSTSSLTLSVFSGGTVVDRLATDGSLGSAVDGGTVVLEPFAPPPGVAGNTWVAVEIDPNSGAILGVNQIINSASSGAVQ